jgi:serine/threonine protein kinase/WD40 repeat protein
MGNSWKSHRKALLYSPSAMDLSVDDRIGRFEILGPLGAGGMGDVYRARDPQLQREVAIKVLPAAFSSDPDRHRRFEQEARAAGSLSHPNIVAVYDVGVHEGSLFIVTELLEGETLRQRMNGRPMAPRTAVDSAIEIARGLAAGHERGIVHRDVKPDNLFVTRDGRLKILDFGLAKLTGPDVSGDVTATLTIDGVPLAPVMGTAAYMSPEQARGLRTDHRTDIFSLGVVLYEMVAGCPAFRRGTMADTLSAVLNDDPRELSSLVPVDRALERLVDHCVEKDPEKRFQSARDLIFALEALPHTTRRAPATPLRRRALSKTSATLAFGILAMSSAAALGYLAGNRALPAARSMMAYTVDRVTDIPGLEEFPSISPDQKFVAFTANSNGRRQIFVRQRAGGPPVPVTKDPADHQFPRWSPDGNSLVYFSPATSGEAQGAIWSIPFMGGSPRRIMASVGGADVNRDGRLACFTLADGNIQLVTALPDGSGVQVIARSVGGYHRYPRWSPDRKWIAFQRGDGVRYDIFVVPAGGGEPRQLTQDRNLMSGLAWLPDSTGVVYGSSRGSTVPYLPRFGLWEVRLDGQTPRQITPVEASYEQPDIHESGLLSAARMQMRVDIWSFPFGEVAAENVDRGVQITRQTGVVLTPTAAPDGTEIAFLSDNGGHGNLWVASNQTELRQITYETDPAVTVGVPVWSPDGRSIAFVSSKGRTGFEFGVWLVDPNGANLRNLVKQGLGLAWSPDSKWVYYADTPPGALKKIALSGGTAVTVRSEPARNVIGLHGATLYFVVERQLVDGQPEFEIHAATPEDGPSRLLARIAASRVPNWQIVNPALSPDGQWLALPLTDGFATNIWALSTATGAWRQVTDFGDRAIFIARRVSWSADGKSILAAVGEGDADIVLLDGLITLR